MHFRYYKSEKLILFLIGLTVLIGAFVTFVVHPCVEHAPETIRNFIVFTELFSVPFFISLVFYYINEIGWKKKIFKWLIDIPNLNGRYEGHLESSFQTNGANTIIQCAVEVKQTASNITIFAYFFNPLTNENSKSDSVIELIEKQKNGSFLLYYIYTNTPGRLHPALNIHEGTTVCIYYPDKKILSGEYYNSRPLTGKFEVEWKSDKLIHRYK
jgi:hypothetical protein